MSESITKPLFLIPRTLSNGTPHFRLYYDATFQAFTLDSGTYVVDDNGVTGDLLDAIETKLNAWIGGTSFDGTFTVDTPLASASTPAWLVRVRYDNSTPTRGGGPIVPLYLRFLTTTLTSTDLGFTAAPGSPDNTGNFIDASPNYILTGPYQRRWLWYPDEYVVRDEAYTVAEEVVDRSPFDGSVVVDDYGQARTRTVTMEFVPGCRVFQFAVNSEMLRLGVPGLALGDPNVALERLWSDCRTYLAQGVPPTLRYVPDVAFPLDYVEVQWVDAEQRRDLRSAAEEMSDAPYRCRVRLILREV